MWSQKHTGSLARDVLFIGGRCLQWAFSKQAVENPEMRNFPPLTILLKTNKQTVLGTDKFPHRRVELRSSVLSGKYGFAPRGSDWDFEPQVTEVQAREACLGKSWVGRPGPPLAVKDHFKILSFPFPLDDMPAATDLWCLRPLLWLAQAIL